MLMCRNYQLSCNTVSVSNMFVVVVVAVIITIAMIAFFSAFSTLR